MDLCRPHSLAADFVMYSCQWQFFHQPLGHDTFSFWSCGRVTFRGDKRRENETGPDVGLLTVGRTLERKVRMLTLGPQVSVVMRFRQGAQPDQFPRARLPSDIAPSGW